MPEAKLRSACGVDAAASLEAAGLENPQII
jgi:hypothetical protein